MNLKNKVLALGILCALGLPQVAGAEGFAINEWSAEGVAMGGARMFAEGDAANVAYNPASMERRRRCHGRGAYVCRRRRC